MGELILYEIGKVILWVIGITVVVSLCVGAFFTKPVGIIESKTILKPTIKLHTDGTTIDTIYVYKAK